VEEEADSVEGRPPGSQAAAAQLGESESGPEAGGGAGRQLAMLVALSHPKRAECEGGREGWGFVRRHVLVVCPLAAFPAVCSSDVVVA